MTRRQLKARFPSAPEAFFQRNASDQPRAAEQREAAVPAPTSHAQGDRVAGVEYFTGEEMDSIIKGLNKTERAYYTRLVMLNVRCLHIQSITLVLAHDCRFTADFSYRDENGRITFVDVKGFQREDALIKIKMAARLFPEFRFVIATKANTIEGWQHKEISA
jgi:hypothetical protein